MPLSTITLSAFAICDFRIGPRLVRPFISSIPSHFTAFPVYFLHSPKLHFALKFWRFICISASGRVPPGTIFSTHFHNIFVWFLFILAFSQSFMFPIKGRLSARPPSLVYASTSWSNGPWCISPSNPIVHRLHHIIAFSTIFPHKPLSHHRRTIVLPSSIITPVCMNFIIQSIILQGNKEGKAARITKSLL